MFFRCGPFYYLIQLSSYDQVLTGVSRRGSIRSVSTILNTILHVRPSRPTNPSRNRWLPDPVWDMITTSWTHEPKHRCRASTMHRVFLMSSHQEPQNVKSGDSNTRNYRSTARAERSLKMEQDYRNIEKSFHRSPLRSNSCEIRSQILKDSSTT